MKRLITTLSALLCLMTWMQGQNYSVRGILELPSGESVGFASVMLKNSSDSSLIKAAYSDKEGIFIFKPVEKGSYFLEISRIGILPYTSSALNYQGEGIDLGVIAMTQQDASMDEVEISAIRPIIEVKPDRTVFNVQNSLTAIGTSGFELLRKAPGVLVDNNNNIIVEGKSGVQIYIDDKPTQLSGEDLVSYLKTIQASDIEAIEIITQPSSKYDAAGSGGIINIRLKRDKRMGFNGSINSGVSYGRYFRHNHSLSLNHRGKRAASFLNYSNNFGRTWYFIHQYRKQNEINFDSETENWSGGPSHNLRAGTDIFLGERSTLGVVVNASIIESESEGLTRTPITPFDAGTPLQVLIAENTSASSSQNYFANLNYRYRDTLGRSWSIDLDYGQFTKDHASFQPNSYYNGGEDSLLFEQNYQMYPPRQIDVWSAKPDYEQKFGNGNLALGAKFSLVSTDNTFEFFNIHNGEEILDENRSNNFVYDEQINAGYVNLSQTWNKFSAQAGLRVEQTISEGILTSAQQNDLDQVKRNYTNFFPSAGMSYDMNRKNSFGFSYSRRIRRPNYRTLNPFEAQLDELSFSRGNPFLQPQYTHNLKVSHTYRSYMVTSLSYSYVNDFFAYISDVLDEQRSFMMTQNIADKEVVNFGLSLPLPVASWYLFYINLNAYRVWYRSDNPKFQPLEQTTMTAYVQNTFSLPKGFKFEISGWFSSPNIWGGTYQTRSLGSVDLGLQKKFLNDKLSARLAFTDVFFSSPWRGFTEFGDLRIDGSGGWESRQVKFSLVYNFGNKDIKSAKKRNSAVEDEAGRIGD